jgi:C-terminal processing protease CtpA/Prc
MSLTQVVSMVRGAVGTFLTIEIADSTMSHTNKFTVKRSRMVFSNRKVQFLEQ